MNYIAEDILMHYGMPRRSGRYPYGSGEDPYQHGRDFLGRVEELRKQDFKYTDPKTGKVYSGDTAIAKSMGLSTTEFRTEVGLAKSERRALDVARAKSLRADGLNDSEIGRKMGVNESTVRSWFNAESEARMHKAQQTADFLKERLEEVRDKGGMIDITSGAELELNVSKELLKKSVYLLEREGYPVYKNRIEQVTNPGQYTTQKVLCIPGTEYKDIYQHDKIHGIKDYISRDGGETYEKKFTYPESMDSKRLQIRYAEEGGELKDGIVELRRGVEDLSLGESRYSQVRILVDGTHYIKGMAVYSDNMPDGVDVIFNTNKKQGTPTTKVLKEIKNDPDNPFGSAIKDSEQGGQYWYTDKNGNKKLGLINKRADEGDWTEWKDKLPSQFLAKQSKAMAEKQLNLAKADKAAEFDEIMSIDNPTVKKYYLNKFAEECDSAAVHLQAAALPGQKYHVIVPNNTLTDKEIYAPGYKDGTKLALIRYPHGGTFEIPILTVNNKNKLGKEIIGDKSMDAVCINKKVADRLSGADFDGDTVMCIPTNDRNGRVKITSTDELKGLKGFDPKEKYGPESYAGREVRLMTKKGTQKEMGIISNLITDMTLAGANEDDLAAAVRHSMVVIDAHKHKLDYRQSAIDNNIAALHKQYQGKSSGGASTIISKAKSVEYVPKRKGTPNINQKGKPWYDPDKPEGALIYKDDPDAYYTKPKINKRTGEVTMVTEQVKQKSTKMAEADDAYSLMSPNRWQMEIIYADYANSMKAMANQARKELISTGKIAYSKEAAKTYSAEVISLNNKLKDAMLNAPRERAALRLANAEIQAKKKAGLFEDRDDEKKAANRAMSKYREEVGAVTRKKRNIIITDNEWKAIQAGAISENRLTDILNNSDPDSLRQRATPRRSSTPSQAQINKINAMRNSNYTLAQIADACGMSTSTVSNILKGVN